MITEGMFIEQRRLETEAEPGTVYDVFSAIGGKRGWFYANWLWKLRGWLDRLIGGVGMSRGRTREGEAQPGDVVDGYTVDAMEPGRLLRLRNDLIAPGPAWMQFEALKSVHGKTLLVLTAFFEPHGLAGLAYWYALYPFHQLVFNGMAREIIKRAEATMERDISLPASE